MNNGSILLGVMAKLGFHENADEGGRRPEPAERPTGDSQQVIDLDNFERRLESILGRRSSDLGDNVFVIDLEKCKIKMGPRWDKLQDNIHETVRGILEKKLTPQDVFVRRDSQSYIVIFAASSARQAQVRCLIIGEEILQRLTGREGTTDLLDVKTVEVDQAGHIKFHELPKIGQILENVSNDLERPTRRADKVAPKTPAESQGSGLEDVRFLYRPMLAVRTKIISTFMCLPVRQVHDNIFLSGYDILGSGTIAKHYLDLDCLTVRTASRDLGALARTGGKSLLAIPVHFETLADSRRRTNYLRLCGEALAKYTDRIVLELVGLPEGIPQVRLTELVSLLRPHGRAVIARFPTDHRNFSAFRISGLHAVGVDLYNTHVREEALLGELDEFAKSAAKNNLKSFALGVRSISLYTAIVAAGFEYAAGHALTSTAETPENAYVYRMESPYLSLLDDKKGVNEGKPTFQDDDVLLVENTD